MFLGIRQIETKRENWFLSEHTTFVAPGIHRVIRHPWYLGGMMIVCARDLSLLPIVNDIVITSCFVIGTYLEERKLIRELGEGYGEYQAKFPCFSLTSG